LVKLPESPWLRIFVLPSKNTPFFL
jgi:hypothetical protein